LRGENPERADYGGSRWKRLRDAADAAAASVSTAGLRPCTGRTVL